MSLGHTLIVSAYLEMYFMIYEKFTTNYPDWYTLCCKDNIMMKKDDFGEKFFMKVVDI